MITVKSIVEKGCIQLPKKLKIQDGTRVLVSIEPILRKREKQQIISELAGSWASDSTIRDIFEEIEHERHINLGREVKF